MSSRWLHFPTPVSTELIANVGGWQSINNGTTTVSTGTSAGPYGTGLSYLSLSSDPTNPWTMFIFSNGTLSEAWRAAYAGKNIRITQDNGDTYDFVGTMSEWAPGVRLHPTTSWAGTFPTGAYGSTNPSTVEFYT